MADDNVILATTQVDTSGLSSGMAQSQAIINSSLAEIKAQYKAASDAVKEASANLAQAAAAFGPAAQAGNAAAIAALKQYESELATAKVAQAELAAGLNQTATATTRVAGSFNEARVAGRAFAQEAGLPMSFLFGQLATQIPAVSSLFSLAFPVIGIVFAVDALESLVKKLTAASEAEKEFAKSANEADAQLKAIARDSEKTDLEAYESKYGKIARLGKELADSQKQELIDRTKLIGVESQIADKKQDIADITIQMAAGPGYTQALADAKEELKILQDGKNGQHVLELQIVQDKADAAALARKVDQASLDQSRTNQNNEITDLNAAAAKKLAALRKADADALEDIKLREGTLSEQQALIEREIAVEQQYPDRLRELNRELITIKAQRQRADEAALREEYGLQETEERNRERLLKETTDFFDRMNKLWTEQYAKETENADRLREIQARGSASIAETGAKGAGQLADLQIQRQKLELEREYGLQVNHTLGQELAYMREIAVLDAEAREAKIQGLESELMIAQTQAVSLGLVAAAITAGTEQRDLYREQQQALEKIAQLQAQINDLAAEDANATYKAQTDALKKQEQEYQRYFDMIERGFDQAIDNWITTGKNFKVTFEKAMREMIENIEKYFINSGIHELFSLGEKQFFKALGIQTPQNQQQQQLQLQRQIEADVKQIRAQAQKGGADNQRVAQQTQTAQTNQATATRQIQQADQQFHTQQQQWDNQMLQAMQQMQQILQQIEQCDCKSQSNPFSSIPVIGSLLGGLGSLIGSGAGAAGAAGAAAAGTTEAVSSTISFGDIVGDASLAAMADGTNYVPKTGPYTLHEGEKVVPRAYNPNAGGNGGGHTFHYHAAANASPADRQQDIENSFRQFKSMSRRFNR